MMEDEGAVFLVQVLIEPYARLRSRQYALKGSLAHGKRIAPQVVTVEFDQVEGPHEHVRVMTAVSDTIERRDPIVPT